MVFVFGILKLITLMNTGFINKNLFLVLYNLIKCVYVIVISDLVSSGDKLLTLF